MVIGETVTTSTGSILFFHLALYSKEPHPRVNNAGDCFRSNKTYSVLRGRVVWFSDLLEVRYWIDSNNTLILDAKYTESLAR